MARRRWPSAIPDAASIQVPAESGPRCRSVSAIRETVGSSSPAGKFSPRTRKPQIPHMALGGRPALGWTPEHHREVAQATRSTEKSSARRRSRSDPGRVEQPEDRRGPGIGISDRYERPVDAAFEDLRGPASQSSHHGAGAGHRLISTEGAFLAEERKTPARAM
jgi:hypothetical protein